MSRASKPTGLTNLWRGEAWQRPADLEIGDTAGLETCATGAVRGCARGDRVHPDSVPGARTSVRCNKRVGAGDSIGGQAFGR